MSEATYDPRPLIARVEWRQARSVPRFPHYYAVQPSEDADDFFAFAELIRTQGEPRLFGKTRYRYLTIDTWTYWLTRSLFDRDAVLINRRLADDDQGARFDGTNYT